MARKWANVFVAMATAISIVVLSAAGRWISRLQKGYRRLVVLFLLGIMLFSVGMLPVRSQIARTNLVAQTNKPSESVCKCLLSDFRFPLSPISS